MPDYKEFEHNFCGWCGQILFFPHEREQGFHRSCSKEKFQAPEPEYEDEDKL